MRTRTPAKREQIVSIAAEVFREHGFSRASMAEIADRVGGSKGTLYSYFPSKAELFFAVTEAAAVEHFASIKSEFDSTDDIGLALRTLGARFLSFVLQPDVVAAHRMVLAVAGTSDIGRSFYERGPKTGLHMVSSFLEQAMTAGRLKRDDSWVMAQQLLALLEAELRPPYMFGVISQVPAPPVIDAAVTRAVKVFLAAYAVSDEQAR